MRIEICKNRGLLIFCHPSFKGQTQKMRIEITPGYLCLAWLSPFQRSNSKNEDWNAIAWISLEIICSLFQRSNSKNEDWNFTIWSSGDFINVCFKGQTQKMRIEIFPTTVIVWISDMVSKVKLKKWGLKLQNSCKTNKLLLLVSKVKLKKWGLKYFKCYITVFVFEMFQRSNSKNEDWNASTAFTPSTLIIVSKVKLKKWGLKCY